MKMQKSLMKRNSSARWISMVLLGAGCLVSGVAVSTVCGAAAKPAVKPVEKAVAKPVEKTADKPEDKAAAKPEDIASIKGTCKFGGNKSTWSAKLKVKSDGTYDADYVCEWGKKTLRYSGTIKTDLKTEISGEGKPSGGGANGTFEFSGKFGSDGVAQCNYKEVGGRGRSGTLTAEMPK